MGNLLRDADAPSRAPFDAEYEMLLPYHGPISFLRAPPSTAGQVAALGFLGLPYDAATTYRPGARLAPNAIRQASMMLTDGAHPRFAASLADELTDLGDLPIATARQDCMLDMVAAGVAELPCRRLLCAGGDHLVTLGVLRGLYARLRRPLALIHFDAHCDTWARHGADDYGHGTWLRNAVEEGLVDPCRTISIGVRSPADPEVAGWLAAQGGSTVAVAAWHAADGGEAIGRRIAEVVGGAGASYLSFDVDVLDPAFAPGTGTPEVGGVSSFMALALFERCLRDHAASLVGMDVVEVCPPYDPQEITALFAATLLWTFAAATGAPCPGQ